MSEKKRSRHTASYRLSKFLNSKSSFEYDFLTGNMVAILRYMYDVMEMTYAQTGVCICKIPLPTIAQYSRTGLNTVKRAIPLFIDHELLSIERKYSGSTTHFGMGNLILTQPTMGSLYSQAELTQPTMGYQPSPNEHVETPNPTHHGSTYKKELFKNIIKKERARTKRACPLSEDFEPTKATTKAVQEMGVGQEDYYDEFEKFMNHYLGEGCSKADWDKVLLNWMIRFVDYKGGNSQRSEPKSAVREYDTEPVRSRVGDKDVAVKALGEIFEKLKLNGKGGHGGHGLHGRVEKEKGSKTQ